MVIAPHEQEVCDAIRRGDSFPLVVVIDVYNTPVRHAYVEALQHCNQHTKIELRFIRVGDYPPAQPPLLPADDSLLQYLRHNTVLRTVRFIYTEQRVENNIPSQLAQAVAENPNIDRLFVGRGVDRGVLSIDSITHLLTQKSHILKELSFGVSNEQGTDSARTCLAQAIGTLHVLESLSILGYVDSRLAPLILQSPLSSCLRALDIEWGLSDRSEATEALATFLRSATSLQQLVLPMNWVGNDAVMMESVIQGVKGCLSLVRSTLPFPNLEEVLQLWNHFFLTGRSDTQSALRELCIRTFNSPGYGIGAWLRQTQILSLSATPPSTTIASSLRFLGLARDDHFGGPSSLWELLAANTNASLQSVQIGTVGHWTELILRLPNMLYLQELNVDRFRLSNNTATVTGNFVQAVRQNTSLHKLIVDQDTFTERERRLMNAFCDRNRLASSVLLGNIQEATGPIPTGAARLSLVPCVFRAIQPIQQTSTRTLLTGLLACDQMIGPGGDGKRANY